MKKILIALLLSILPTFIFGGRLGAPSEELSLTILNPHSHPGAGEDWIVEFETTGTADLTITPMDQATIDDLEFVSATCDGEERTPQILDGDVIFYPDWSCEETGEVIHLVNVARPHTLKFQFGSQEEHAYHTFNQPETIKSQEVVSKRTRNSKTFKNPDGTYTWSGSLGDIHYLDDNGNWEDINISIESSQGGCDYENTKNNFKSFFKKNSKSKDVVKYQDKDSYITYTFEDNELGTVNEVEGYPEDNMFVYPNVYDGVDVRYSISARQLLEEFIIPDPITIKNIDGITQKIHFENAHYEEQGDGSIIFYSSDTDEEIWLIPKPVMYELNNKENKNYGTHYEITQNREDYSIKKVLDKEGKDWLFDPERVYPVVVDTTIERQVAADSDDCFSMGNFFYSTYPNTDYGIAIGRAGPVGCFNAGVRFTGVTMDIGGGSIDTAKITVYSSGNGYGSSLDLDIYGDDQNNPPTFSEGNEPNDRTFTTAHEDWSLPSKLNLPPSSTDTPDITSIIQELYTSYGPFSNEALAFFIDAPGSHPQENKDYFESHETDSAKAAELTITYTYTFTNQAPTCSLVASPDSGTAPLSVTLDGSGSSDPDGSIVKYEWDWTDDGSYDYSESPGDGVATHDYDEGNHTARLRVTDDDGATSTCTDTISVSVPPIYQPDKTMCDDSSGRGGGVVSALTISSPDPSQPLAISQRGWVVTGYSGVERPSYSELQTMYDYTNATTISSLSDISGSGIYKVGGELEIKAGQPYPCDLGVSALIFVDGDLTIERSFTNDTVSGDPLSFKNNCGSSLTFIVHGDADTSDGDVDITDSDVNNVYGIFYAAGSSPNGIINTGTSNNPLYVFGSLIARSFALGRNLGADNADYPAEQVIFMPKYFLTLKDVLGKSQYTWKEVKSP